jgi:trimethylamine:corrinoid methyltransferase-like protein
MFTQAQFLSQEEQQIIHDESIRILEEVGALFHSKKALGILEKNGARVDHESACLCKRIRVASRVFTMKA